MAPTTLGSVIDIDGLLAAADRTLPLPVTMSRIAVFGDLPSLPRADLVEVIRFDPVLTAMALRRAGNVRPAGVATVEEASSVLDDGLDKLVTATRAAFLADAPDYGYDASSMWRTSALVTVATDVIIESAGGRVPPDAVSAAAMHQLGKIVLWRYLGPNIFRMIASAAETDGYSEIEAELETLQVSHGEVAAFVLRSWGLAEPIVTGVRHCQVPDIGGDPVSYAVALASIMASEVAAGATLRTAAGRSLRDESPVDTALTAEAHAKLGIDPAMHNEMLHVAAGRFGQVASRFGVA